MTIPTAYDAIVIGAGHNGLVTAAYLAQAGQRVLVLERRTAPGGVAATEEIEKGFKFETGLHDLSGLRPGVVQELGLARHGLELLPSAGTVFSPLAEGRHLLLGPRVADSVAAIGRWSASDAGRFAPFAERLHRLASFLGAVQATSMPDVAAAPPGELLPLLPLGVRLRRLGEQATVDFLRFMPMAVAELLDDEFETAVLKGTLGAAGITGLFQGPRASGTVAVLLHHLVGRALGDFRATVQARGGTAGLIAALVAAARANGAQVRCDAEVAQIVVRAGRAAGVVLASGEELAARRVISSADPRRTLLGLVDPQHFDPSFVRQVSRIRFRGACARVNLALARLPEFPSLPGAGGHLHGTISISPSLDYLEHAYDDAKHGRWSRRPYLEAVIPSLADPSLAPAGQHVMSILVQYAPYHLAGGWTAAKREALGDAVVATLVEVAPNVHQAILARQVLTPADLEARHGLTEGHLYHGELMLDQLFFMRPVPGWSQYRTPIANLYLCGAGTHPGGGLTGQPGQNAARAILADVKSRKE